MASKPKTKMRLDLLLVERGLAESRSKAQALIMAGNVHGKDRRLDKAGQELSVDAEITVKGRDHPWVSRGGIKLAHGLLEFDIDPSGLICLDVGASTGGFTDVLLQGGAAKVYAVDVGHGQLAWSLRNDERVVVLERTNARYLGRDDVPDEIDLIVCDASFIGLRTVLPAAMALAAPGARMVALIKPQFEVGPERVGKGGVVRDPDLHAQVCAEITSWLAGQSGWSVLGTATSPIKGPQGNIEFLLGGRRD
ncbi:MAG: TlyA family RNA methyltransferase [Alphaproteobacteria bacterium]|jgi:23S rRNA (cytidine1920-2'-O)/16S rRNA (cytidine1409-2'-O)-methyltransferase|nr:TlyA family RNA methyltransferase [Alphaproteobacteria bacterium]MDP6830632.1 TlyA family RNA methyltransferase [Alphaproteobacteria bacterium]MDP6872314.1 TlyA family RNA methyltransferase [Alphaproteobacteria bacterium]